MPKAAVKGALKVKYGPTEGSLEKINPALEKWIIPIGSIALDPKNPRTHSARNLEAIKNSLATFGQQTPIVVSAKTKEVAKGNGTLIAAKELGWKKIAAIPTDIASKKLLTGYKVADNKTGDLSDWDFEILSEHMKEYVDLNWIGLGWEDYELQPLRDAKWTAPKIENDASSGDTTEFKNLRVTQNQWSIMQQAIDKAKTHADQTDMTDGRALELICADYLGS